MTDYDILGRPISRNKKSNESPFGGNINIGFGSSTKKEKEKDEKRSFGVGLQKNTYDKQGGKCYKCHKNVKVSHMEFHHLTFWSKGGKTTSDNCVGLCHECHKDIHDEARIKENDKKRKAKPRDKGLVFGGGLLGKPQKRSKNSPFGF